MEYPPQFPGGIDGLMKYLSKNIKYPIEAQKNHIQGKVFVTFVVNREGAIGQVNLLKGIGSGCDEETIRVVRSMPNWIPGKQGNKNVSVRYTLPVSFTLSDDELPLYLVDGKEMKPEDINKINPNDVQNVEILKEQDKIKPYGKKGKNGVVLITMKKSSINN